MKQILTKKTLMLISLVLVVTMFIPSTEANNIALSNSEINHLPNDNIGLLHGGIKIIDIDYDEFKNNEFIEIDTKLTFFNTKGTPITLRIIVEQFYEEREHTVKDNYIYYFLPTVDWIQTPDEITIQPNHKYNLPVHIKLPKKEAFEKAHGGGYICLVSGYWGEELVQSSTAHKLFINIPTDIENTKEKQIINSFFDVFIYSIIGTIILFIFLKYSKKYYLIWRGKKNEMET